MPNDNKGNSLLLQQGGKKIIQMCTSTYQANKAVTIISTEHDNEFQFIFFLKNGWVLIIGLYHCLFSIVLAISSASLKSILIYEICRVAVWCSGFMFLKTYGVNRTFLVGHSCDSC